MLELSDAFVGQLPTLALKVAVATVCGILLGIERERKDKPAGLRTITLITIGAALFMIVSGLIPLTLSDAAAGSGDTAVVDPSRIAAQVVTGIGFLGAGTIIQSRGSIHGLTTAAMIWVSAGIGLCIGAGFPLLGAAMTLLVLAALVVMEPIRVRISRRSPAHTIRFAAPSDTLTIARLRQLLHGFDVPDRDISFRAGPDGTIEATARHHASGDSFTRMLDALARIDGVRGLPLPPEG